MGEDTVTTEAPGVESGAETNAGVLSEADLAASFVDRVETDEETAPESEASEVTETVGDAVAEEDQRPRALRMISSVVASEPNSSTAWRTALSASAAL